MAERIGERVQLRCLQTSEHTLLGKYLRWHEASARVKVDRRRRSHPELGSTKWPVNISFRTFTSEFAKERFCSKMLPDDSLWGAVSSLGTEPPVKAIRSDGQPHAISLHVGDRRGLPRVPSSLAPDRSDQRPQ